METQTEGKKKTFPGRRSEKMGLGDYECPLCGWKVKDGGRLFMHDNKIGAFVCGECIMKRMKLEQKEKVDNIGEYKRKFADFDKSEKGDKG